MLALRSDWFGGAGPASRSAPNIVLSEVRVVDVRRC